MDANVLETMPRKIVFAVWTAPLTSSSSKLGVVMVFAQRCEEVGILGN